MSEKLFFFRITAVLIFSGLCWIAVNAQDDPCVPAYRLSNCETGDAACKAKEDREYAEHLARCRAKRNSNNTDPSNPSRRNQGEAAGRNANSERDRLNNAINSEVEKKTRLNDAIKTEMNRKRSLNSAIGKEMNSSQKAGNKKGVSTEAARCIDFETVPPWQKWLYIDGEKYGLKPGCNGDWRDGEFTASCWGSDKLFLNTYLTAFIENSKGNPSCTGGILKISNHSKRYPAYYGLSGVLNEKLEPGETRKIELTIYRSKHDKRTTRVPIRVKWWAAK